MASASQTATVGAGDWVYIDKFGAPHNVTTSQAFVFYLTDTSTTDVQYQITVVTDGSQTLNCDDGGEVQMIADVISANSSEAERTIGPMTDAMDTVATVGIEGRWLMSYNNGPVQEWKPASITVDDIDDPGTFTATWEDQFGNRMTWDAIPCA
jgi:hypothetical protein